MHWSRLKTILIFLFLFVDIILSVYLLINVYNADKTDDGTIRETTEILARNGVMLETEIPNKVLRMGMVEMESIWPDEKRLAQQLLGGSATGKNGVYSNGTETLEISDALFKAKLFPPETVDFFDFLKSRGIFAEEAEKADNMFIRQTIEEFPIFETGISISTENTSKTLSGYWIISEKSSAMAKKQETKLMPVTSVLIDFVQNPEINKNGETITAIETGYTLGSSKRDAQHKLVSVFPAYKITTKTGRYIYDATSGEFLYSEKTQ